MKISATHSCVCFRKHLFFHTTILTCHRGIIVTLGELGFPGVSAGKESTCNVGDPGSIPGLGRFPGEEKGYSLQYSDLENSMDCIVHGVTKSQPQLSDFHFHIYCHRKCQLMCYRWLSAK